MVQTCALAGPFQHQANISHPAAIIHTHKRTLGRIALRDQDPTPPPVSQSSQERQDQQLTCHSHSHAHAHAHSHAHSPLGRLTSARDTPVHASPRSRTSRAFLFADGTGRNARRLTKNLIYLLICLLSPHAHQRRHVSSSPAATLRRRGASCSSGSITAAPSMRPCMAQRMCDRQLSYST